MASSQRPEGPVQFILQVAEPENDTPKEVFETWAGGKRETIKRLLALPGLRDRADGQTVDLDPQPEFCVFFSSLK